MTSAVIGHYLMPANEVAGETYFQRQPKRYGSIILAIAWLIPDNNKGYCRFIVHYVHLYLELA